jgi:hypothetical protein
MVLTDLALLLRYAENAVRSRLAVMASLLRLGTKYSVTHFRQIAVTYLFQVIPTTLDEYTKLQAGRPFMFKHHKNTATMLVVLHLARECDLPALLPCCLWYFTANSGELSQRYRPGSDESSFMAEDGRKYALDLETYSSCLSAGWQLDERRRSLIGITLTECGYSDHCCLKDARDMVAALERPWMNLLDKVHSSLWAEEFDLCSLCANGAERFWDESREESWDTLPGYYGLTTWEELLAASQVASES